MGVGVFKMNTADIKEIYYEKVKKLCEFAWREKISRSDIDYWLENFSGQYFSKDVEEAYALHLLSNFMYFSLEETRELLKSLFEDIYKYPHIERIRRDNSNTLDRNVIDPEFDKVLAGTRFIGVGNPSESGSMLLYYFRQVNGLSTSSFINAFEIVKRTGSDSKLKFDGDVKEYVFLDDLCGTGEQACGYSVDLVEDIKRIDKSVKVHYYALFATDHGLQTVKDQSQFDDVKCVYELDESFKVFSEYSRTYLNNKHNLAVSDGEKIFKGYGNTIFPGHPLGYGNSQLLLGFFYNTPDNTLPVIWVDGSSSNGWRPVFKRFGKII